MSFVIMIKYIKLFILKKMLSILSPRFKIFFRYD